MAGGCESGTREPKASAHPTSLTAALRAEGGSRGRAGDGEGIKAQ